MPGVKVEIKSDLWTRFDGMRRDLGFKLDRAEYQVIASLIQIMIRDRTQKYHLDAYCKPFIEYSWLTEKSKRPLIGEASWSAAEYILRALQGKLAAEARKRSRPEVLQAIRRQIGHFQTEINEAQEAYYSALAKNANDVNLTKTGRMLDSLEAKGTSNAARLKVKCKWGDWNQRGVAAAKRQGRGELPARPFVGITDAELNWIFEKILEPLYKWYASELAAMVQGKRGTARPNAARLAIDALRDKPTPNEERRAG